MAPKRVELLIRALAHSLERLVVVGRRCTLHDCQQNKIYMFVYYVNIIIINIKIIIMIKIVLFHPYRTTLTLSTHFVLFFVCFQWAVVKREAKPLSVP